LPFQSSSVLLALRISCVFIAYPDSNVQVVYFHQHIRIDLPKVFSILCFHRDFRIDLHF